MNVIVTEVYVDDGPVTWICDTASATIGFQGVVAQAQADPNKSVEASHLTSGWQDGTNRANAHIHPPCQVDDYITVYFD